MCVCACMYIRASAAQMVTAAMSAVSVAGELQPAVELWFSLLSLSHTVKRSTRLSSRALVS